MRREGLVKSFTSSLTFSLVNFFLYFFLKIKQSLFKKPVLNIVKLINIMHTLRLDSTKSLQDMLKNQNRNGVIFSENKKSFKLIN